MADVVVRIIASFAILLVSIYALEVCVVLWLFPFSPSCHCAGVPLYVLPLSAYRRPRDFKRIRSGHLNAFPVGNHCVRSKGNREGASANSTVTGRARCDEQFC